MNSNTFIDDYFQAMDEVNRTLSRTDIARAIDILYQAWEKDGTIYTIGNGGSASTATHFACDLAKYTTVPEKKRVRAISLVDNIPLVSALTNDLGFHSIFVEQLRPSLDANDVVVGLSVHGGSGSDEAGPWSQNLVQAMTLAKERRAGTIGMSGFGGGALLQSTDVCIVVPWDTEPLGTLLVESYHLAMHHLICGALKQRIAES
jgi:D-sedoheptulose 7-phosphate isomerase